jgi:REP element-mobilizing transposase RayT
MYILTKVNEEGYTNREVFASMNLENVLDVMKGMITIEYQEDRGLIEGLLDQFYTIDARAEVQRRLEEDKYYSLSGPDETPFEIAAMDNEQDMVDFYRQAEPQNAPMNNANNFNENENRRYWNRRREEMNFEQWANEEAMRALDGGKRKQTRKARKTRKAKKSKKSKKTRRH